MLHLAGNDRLCLIWLGKPLANWPGELLTWALTWLIFDN
jgi:hypothetical protein